MDLNWKPDDRTLAGFSEAGMFVLGLIAAPVSAWRGHWTAAAIFWVLAVGLRLVGLVRPRALKPVYLGLSLATYPIGWTISHLVLLFIYVLVFTPLALFFRFVNRDALARRTDPDATTYWEPYDPDRGLERYLRQY
jgi:hypothetical protein